MRRVTRALVDPRIASIVSAMHYTTPSHSSDSKLWAVASHAGPLAAVFLSGGLLAFAVPLGVWLLKRNEDSFAAEHARASLNFQLSLLTFGLVSAVLVFLTFGIAKLVLLPLWMVIAFMSVLLTVVGSIRAWRGLPHHYPFTINYL